MPLHDDSVLVEMPRRKPRDEKSIDFKKRDREIATRRKLNASRRRDADENLEFGLNEVKGKKYKFVS